MSDVLLSMAMDDEKKVHIIRPGLKSETGSRVEVPTRYVDVAKYYQEQLQIFQELGTEPAHPHSAYEYAVGIQDGKTHIEAILTGLRVGDTRAARKDLQAVLQHLEGETEKLKSKPDQAEQALTYEHECARIRELLRQLVESM